MKNEAETMTANDEAFKQRLKDLISDCDSDLSTIQQQIQELTDKQRQCEKDRQAYLHTLERLGGTTQTMKRTKHNDATTNIRYQQIPFRQAILHALSTEPDGMSPSDVAKFLKDKGLEVSGSTTLETRVSNELFRLAKNGRAEKVKRGVYRVSDNARQDLLESMYD